MKLLKRTELLKVMGGDGTIPPVDPGTINIYQPPSPTNPK